MHSFARARRRHNAPGEAPAPSAKATQATKGLVLSGGWRYDLTAWFFDTFWFRRQWQALRRRTVTLARVQPGEQVLDVGCGTGTLALDVARTVGSAGRVAGIDPSAQQIARARAKAARRRLSKMSIEFQLGVIERLPFPDHINSASVPVVCGSAWATNGTAWWTGYACVAAAGRHTEQAAHLLGPRWWQNVG